MTTALRDKAPAAAFHSAAPTATRNAKPFDVFETILANSGGEILGAYNVWEARQSQSEGSRKNRRRTLGQLGLFFRGKEISDLRRIESVDALLAEARDAVDLPNVYLVQSFFETVLEAAPSLTSLFSRKELLTIFNSILSNSPDDFQKRFTKWRSVPTDYKYNHQTATIRIIAFCCQQEQIDAFTEDTDAKSLRQKALDTLDRTDKEPSTKDLYGRQIQLFFQGMFGLAPTLWNPQGKNKEELARPVASVANSGLNFSQIRLDSGVTTIGDKTLPVEQATILFCVIEKLLKIAAGGAPIAPDSLIRLRNSSTPADRRFIEKSIGPMGGDRRENLLKLNIMENKVGSAASLNESFVAAFNETEVREAFSRWVIDCNKAREARVRQYMNLEQKIK